MVDDYPILTLLPPLLAIGLVVATRKVLLSLGLGVVAAALLIEGFSPWGTVTQVLGAFGDIFWIDGAVNTAKVCILAFTLMLGVITALIMMSGGIRAFADWAQRRITTRRGATLLPAGLGVAIFVDDYFNALAVGQVSRPVTDTRRVSRAKLALIVPFVLLVVGVLGGIVWTGQRSAGSWSVIDILASTDVTFALIVGGVLGLAGAIYYYARDTSENPVFGASTVGRGWLEGARSMLPVVFLLAAAVAFATGTSWGSFGLLIPLAGGIINSLDAPELLLPAMGAVLAGAVSGDHGSPISDTTILSATGAGCNVITRAITGALAFLSLRVWGPSVDPAEVPESREVGTG